MDRITSTTGGSTAALLPGGLDEYFLRTDSNGESVPLTDALGSIIAMTGASGTMNTTYWYSPYGLTTIAGVASGNSTQYAGRENDQTSLYYYRARYYSPEIGRFISQDPSGLAAGLNLYEYAGDDPVNFDDPLGLNSRPSGLAGGGFPPVCTFLVCMTFGGNPTPTPPNNPGPGNPSNNPPNNPNRCGNAAANTFGRDMLVGEGVGGAFGAVVGGLVAAGLTVATDAYPFAGQSIPSSMVFGFIAGAISALSQVFVGAAADAAWTYFSCSGN